MDDSPATAGKATVGAGYLHTPSEHSYDSFSDSRADEIPSKQVRPLPATLSPPVSPGEINKNDPASTILSSLNNIPEIDPSLFPEPDRVVRDDPLFSDNFTSGKLASDPRYASAFPQELAPLQGILPHETRPNPQGKIRIPGTDYILDATPEAAKQYYKECMAQASRMLRDGRGRPHLPAPSQSAAAPRDDLSKSQLHKLTLSAGVSKPKPSARRASEPRKRLATAEAQSPESSTVRSASPEHFKPVNAGPSSKRSRTPRNATTSHSDFYDSAFPDKKHKRSAPSKATPAKSEDFNWRDIPDHCPPVTEAELQRLGRDVKWTGSPLDIADEQDYDELKPREVMICRTLRLKPVQYLANKRRIFATKVKFMQEGKNFTKTAAQNVTNIDVNKSSRMFEAFALEGWFNESRYA